MTSANINTSNYSLSTRPKKQRPVSNFTILPQVAVESLRVLMCVVSYKCYGKASLIFVMEWSTYVVYIVSCLYVWFHYACTCTCAHTRQRSHTRIHLDREWEMLLKWQLIRWFCLSVCRSVCWSVCQSVCLSVRLSVRPSLSACVYMQVHIFVSPSVSCLFSCLPVCLHVFSTCPHTFLLIYNVLFS